MPPDAEPTITLLTQKEREHFCQDISTFAKWCNDQSLEEQNQGTGISPDTLIIIRRNAIIYANSQLNIDYSLLTEHCPGQPDIQDYQEKLRLPNPSYIPSALRHSLTELGKMIDLPETLLFNVTHTGGPTLESILDTIPGGRDLKHYFATDLLQKNVPSEAYIKPVREY